MAPQARMFMENMVAAARLDTGRGQMPSDAIVRGAPSEQVCKLGPGTEGCALGVQDSGQSGEIGVQDGIVGMDPIHFLHK